jgi:hypothetical protein
MRKSSTSIGEVDLAKLKAESSEEVDDTESSLPARFLLRRSEPISNLNSIHNPVSDHSDADDESDKENDGVDGDHSESDSEDDCVSMSVVTRRQPQAKSLRQLVTAGRCTTPELSIGSSSPSSSPFSTRFRPISRVETTGSASGTDREISFRPSKAPARAKSGFSIGSSDEEDSEEEENSD